MRSSYWERFGKTRSTRRRFMGAGASLSAGAAGLALVGCGNDDDSGDTPANGNGDAPANGNGNDNGENGDRYGGTIRYPFMGTNSGDPPTLFPYENLTYLAQHPASMHYSRLLTEVSGADVDPDDYTALEGDLAEGMPEQPDERTYIFRLRENAHFHNKPPLDGRPVTADDIAQAYQAFISMSQNAAAYEEVIESVEPTDDRTVQVTLREPFAPFLTVHASTPEGFWIIPVESIDGGQAQEDPVGTGPWIFDSWDSGVSMSWNRNPDYFIPELPYFDRVEGSLIAEPQRLIAGLRAGDFDYSLLGGNLYEEAQDQLDPDGRDHFYGNPSYGAFYFNFDIEDGRWRDIRVRQALSMSLDREAVNDVLDQTGQGDWFSPFCATNLVPFHLSPRDDDYGETGRFFQYDPEEARALLDAALGDTSPQIRVTANIDRYGRGAEQLWELLVASLQEVGWDVELTFQEYGSYIQSTFLGEIDEGVGLGPLVGSPRDPDDILSRNLASSSARRNWGGQPIDQQDRIDEMIREQRVILDPDERLEYIHEMQRELAEYMLVVPYSAAAGYAWSAPWVQDFYWKNSFAVHRAAMTYSYFTPERIAED